MNDDKDPNRPIFVRMPPKLADRLDRASTDLGWSKREVLARLIDSHLDPAAEGWGFRGRPGRGPFGPGGPFAAAAASGAGSAESASGPGGVLDLSEVAALLKVDETAVQTLAESGELPGRRIGDQWRFSRGAVLRWLEASE
jgi:excisionase family DNA binding protein